MEIILLISAIITLISSIYGLKKLNLEIIKLKLELQVKKTEPTDNKFVKKNNNLVRVVLISVLVLILINGTIFLTYKCYNWDNNCKDVAIQLNIENNDLQKIKYCDDTLSFQINNSSMVNSSIFCKVYDSHEMFLFDTEPIKITKDINDVYFDFTKYHLKKINNFQVTIHLVNKKDSLISTIIINRTL